MQSSKEANVVTFRCDLDHLGRPVAETFLLGIDQIMWWSLDTTVSYFNPFTADPVTALHFAILV